MSRRRKQKKGPSPLFAVCLLLAGVWVAARGLLGGGVVADPLALGSQGSSDGAVPDEATGGQDADAESVPFVDLLHAFGSYQRGREVRLAFAAFDAVLLGGAERQAVRPSVDGSARIRRCCGSGS